MEQTRRLASRDSRAARLGTLLVVALVAALLSCETPTRGARGTRSHRTGKYPTTQRVAQLAVDDPCQYLGTVHKMSREVIERLRAREQVTLEEWACMAEVLVDVNYEVGMECHHRKVKFREFAERQEEGHRRCLPKERAKLARCAVIQVSWKGSAGFCD